MSRRQLFGFGRDEGDNACSCRCGDDVVGEGLEVLEGEEGEGDEEEEEEQVVEEDRQVGGLGVGNLIGLPQNPLVFLLLRHLLVVGQRSERLNSNSTLTATGDAVLEDVLSLLVGEGDETRCQDGRQRKGDGSLKVGRV